jgi:hypothetical protein
MSDEELDTLALIRAYVPQRPRRPLPPLEEDPIWELVGAVDTEPASVDEVVYRP